MVASHTNSASGSTYLATEERLRNQGLNILEYRRGEVVLQSRPLALFIELTQNCNLKCPMCRYGAKYQPEWNMPRDMFEQITEELFPTALMVDLRGWGESTILKDFDELLDMTLAHRPQVRLVTNAQANRPEIWDRLMAAQATVTVSCDAADPDLFAVLRRGGTIERLKRSVSTMVEARERHHAPVDCVVFNSVVSRDNLHDLPNIVSLAADLGVPKVIALPIVTALANRSHLRGDLDGVERAYAAAGERARAEGVEFQLGSAPDPALALPDKVRTPPCMHPWAFAYVNHQGGVGFCDHLIGNPQFVLGSLRERSFDDIWNGPEWVEVRQSHLAGEIPDRFSPCRWSYAQRYVDFEHMIHPDRAQGIVSTRTHLQLTVRRDPAQAPAVPWLPEMGLLPLASGDG